MEVEVDDASHGDGETAGEADAPAAASTTTPMNETGKRVLNAGAEPFVPSPAAKRTCVPTASVGTLLQEVQVDKERVRGA